MIDDADFDPDFEIDVDSDDDDESTRLDEAWAAAQAVGATEDAAARFIDVLLAEALVCPIFDEDDAEADDESESVQPRLVEIAGRETVLLFDSEERLAEYVEEPTAFIAAPGRAFFDMAAANGAQIALNLDVAESSTVFEPHVVQAISTLAAESDDEVSLELDESLTVEAPDDASPALLGALAARVGAARALLAEAWLAVVQLGDSPTAMALGLRPTDGVDIEELRELARELARLGGSFSDDGSPLDVALLREGDGALDAFRRVGFGLLAQA